MDKVNNHICPECGQTMERGLKPQIFSYKGMTTTFDMPGWYCEGCGEGIHTGSDMQVSDRHLNEIKARQENMLLPEEVRRIRRKLKLNQQTAGRLLGGGTNAFHKYEKGEILPSKAISNLLRVLEKLPQGIEVLREESTQAQT